jgi:long-subunit fatty acid transport protein
MIFWKQSKDRCRIFKTFLLLLFFPVTLNAQFSGYSQADSSSYNAALFSNGAGLRDPLSNLAGNPAFLISHGKNLTEAGGASLVSQQTFGPILFNGGGFYSVSESFGFGLRLKPVYTKFFPADERLVNYAGQAFLSYKLSEIFYLGFGVGPTVSNRPGGFSSYSWNVFGSLGIIYRAFTFGLVIESPGSNRFNNYLGSETLKERYPEKISVGVQYQILPQLFLYSELVRTFWERAVFSQNGLEEKPPFPVNTSYTGNIGLGYRLVEQLDILFGFSQLANPARNGSLDPLHGVSLGLKGQIFPSVFGPGVFGSLYVQRIGISKTKEPFEEETRFGFQFQMQYDVRKDDINMPNM